MAEVLNAAAWLTERNVAEGRGENVAVRCGDRQWNYEELTAEVRRVAGGLRAMGVRPEERVMLFMVDGPELFTGILGAMYLGAVAVPVSTMLTGADLSKLVVDSRARVLVGSAEFAEVVRAGSAEARDLHDVVLTGSDVGGLPRGVQRHGWSDLVAAGESEGEQLGSFGSWPDSPALWLYTSGTTGTPKGAMHRHTDIRFVAETYGQQVLGIRPDDVSVSVAKLFFAYGIGNSMFLPLSVGATTVLEPARPTPEVFAALLTGQTPTLFFGVPTFYAGLLASDIADDSFSSVRQGASAGEPLPAKIFERMKERFGIEVLDGIGSTETLHIFLSNRPGQVNPGSSGTPVPGYEVQIRADDGSAIEAAGEPGTLFVHGESIATGYWCRTEVNRAVFQGEWMRTGDTYVRNDDGTYTCLGRDDDMMKAGGIWVTPAEVEERLLEHPDVAEVAVVGVPDSEGLDKPVACVVAAPGAQLDPDALIAHCRQGLAAFKRPREVVVVEELPKTATGKVQRFAVRDIVSEHLASSRAER
ncbi:MAG: benzoate-CoA ligase family protein [Actinomycetota bacterium]|nr:benzoate-CoA ligase family protein [Actinomycetota bacterium]